MLATAPKPLTPEQLRVLSDDVLDTLSSLAQDLFDEAFYALHFATAYRASEMIDLLDKEQARRAYVR